MRSRTTRADTAPGLESAAVVRLDSTRAWAIAAAGLLANAACWGTLNSFGAFLGSMTDEFHTGLGGPSHSIA